MIERNKRLIIILIACLLLLLIPLLAMQFTSEVSWTIFDFFVAGAFLLITGLLLEIILITVKKTGHKIVFIIILFLLFFIIWAELAVGIIGTPFAGS